jgi:hypothetical protein
VVCESGAENAGDALRIFNEHKKSMHDAGIDVLRSLTLDTKDSTPALMLADFFAHTRWLREFKGIPFTDDDLVPLGEKVQTTAAALNFVEGGLAGQKERLIEQFRNRMIPRKEGRREKG